MAAEDHTTEDHTEVDEEDISIFHQWFEQPCSAAAMCQQKGESTSSGTTNSNGASKRPHTQHASKRNRKPPNWLGRPEASLDLHGLSSTVALATTKQFVQDCQRHRLHEVVVITGKGLRSDSGIPVLRETIISWLSAQAIGTFCTAEIMGRYDEPTYCRVELEKAGAVWMFLSNKG